jgi:hypothetical protein
LENLFSFFSLQKPFLEFNKKKIYWKVLNFSDWFQIKFNIYE